MMAKDKALLIIGPSFRRKTGTDLQPALERYDGLFFRVAREYLRTAKNIDVAVMIDDLKLVNGSTPLPYREPEGTTWGGKLIMKNTIENAIVKNQDYLVTKLSAPGSSTAFGLRTTTMHIIKSGTGVSFPSISGNVKDCQSGCFFLLQNEKLREHRIA